MFGSQKVPMDPVAVFADEYRALGAWGRFLVRLASPRMAKAAKVIAAQAPTYNSATFLGRTRDERPSQDGPVTRYVESKFAGAGRR